MRTITMTRQRWVTHSLNPIERPNLIYEYYVSGRGQFPWDMLRCDMCWPATEADARLLNRDESGLAAKRLRSIRMRSHYEPLVERWSSFGWSVGLDRLDG